MAGKGDFSIHFTEDLEEAVHAALPKREMEKSMNLKIDLLDNKERGYNNANSRNVY